jgi:hypothetical protein
LPRSFGLVGKPIENEAPVIAFKVKHMYSSRSAGLIVKTLRALDSGARVRVNMETNLVEIEPSWARPDAFREAIGKAGFSLDPATQPATQAALATPVDVLLPLD